MAYHIEYKTKAYPYNYVYLEKSNGTLESFDTLAKARKKAMALTQGPAILCVIRGGVEQLVYRTTLGEAVLENRDLNKWYFLKKDGTLGAQIGDRKNITLIRSMNQIW